VFRDVALFEEGGVADDFFQRADADFRHPLAGFP
jgi:hypothetical protein